MLGTAEVGSVCGCSDQIINASGSIKAGTAEVQSPRYRGIFTTDTEQKVCSSGGTA